MTLSEAVAVLFAEVPESELLTFVQERVKGEEELPDGMLSQDHPRVQAMRTALAVLRDLRP